MSLHTSFVLIEGDHRREIERLLAEFGYDYALVPRAAPSFAAASKTLFQWQVSATVVKKAVGCVRGWTVLCDPERHLAAEPWALKKLARITRSRVFSMVCDGTSGAFGFALVRGPSTRAWFSGAGGELHEEGEALPEESGFPHDHPCEEEIARLMERVAFPIGALDEPGSWQVLTLEAVEAAHAAVAGAADARKRHWWRFW
jgi:hypothetical protein